MVGLLPVRMNIGPGDELEERHEWEDREHNVIPCANPEGRTRRRRRWQCHCLWVVQASHRLFWFEYGFIARRTHAAKLLRERVSEQSSNLIPTDGSDLSDEAIQYGTALVRWTVRSASPASCVFVGYVLFIILRSTVEVDLFGQFSFAQAMFLAAFVYARQSRERYLSTMPSK
jgi:hypothetical protein